MHMTIETLPVGTASCSLKCPCMEASFAIGILSFLCFQCRCLWDRMHDSPHGCLSKNVVRKGPCCHKPPHVTACLSLAPASPPLLCPEIFHIVASFQSAYPSYSEYLVSEWMSTLVLAPCPGKDNLVKSPTPGLSPALQERSGDSQAGMSPGQSSSLV